MPRKKDKKKGHHRCQGVFNAADVTLNDFANTDVASGKTRMKKATSKNAIVKVFKEQSTAEVLTTLTTVAEEKDWFDMSLDEFHFDSGNEDEEDHSIEPYQCIRSTRTRRKKSTKIVPATTPEEEGIDYPIDIWFILGDYMRPEDVLRFSLICKSAHTVTQTSKFWSRLYKRYYKPIDCLPVRLQPGVCLERLFGLRPCVIRSLYYFYQPFLERMKNRSEVDNACLLRRVVDTLWHQKGRGMFHYYFKLKEQDDDKNFRHKRPDLMEMLTDINANTEKRCKVLQLSSRTFTALPPTILGQTLLSVSSVLSSDLRSSNIRLIFGPPHVINGHVINSQKKNPFSSFTHVPENAIAISINHVIITKILDWWVPQYPHSREERPTTSDSSSIPEDIFF